MTEDDTNSLRPLPPEHFSVDDDDKLAGTANAAPAVSGTSDAHTELNGKSGGTLTEGAAASGAAVHDHKLNGKASGQSGGGQPVDVASSSNQLTNVPGSLVADQALEGEQILLVIHLVLR